MNTTVQALQALYVKLGGSLTDTYDNIADGATVADYATIPDMVNAIAQISKAENLINSVSDDDNGKILTVVDGAAEFAEPDVNTFIEKVKDCIVGYNYEGGNIYTTDHDLLKMFSALDGVNTIRAVCSGMQNEGVADYNEGVADYFALQSYSNNVEDIDPETGDITSVTHTVIFASFIPTVAGAKMRFITQTVVTNAPTYETFDIVSQSATYEEKDIPITP